VSGSESIAFDPRPIGYVVSPLRDLSGAPNQGDEGAPDARIVIFDPYLTGIEDLSPGMNIIVVTWLHQADRSVLRTIPRGDPKIREHGVFSTRSPDRPNPLGLHRVRVLSVDGNELEVGPLEAIDQTPVLDIKPVLDATKER
jgi:tRNA-Thr(GGU) m(6)t(6)A37 methyltransferase TsaA